MKLRAELVPPVLNESKVARLAELAAYIDGASPGEWEGWLDEFNNEAGTAFDFFEFQGLYGGQEYETWVRKVLGKPKARRVPDVTREELIELARRVIQVDGSEHEIAFYLSTLALNIPEPNISDLIFWPGEYFADGDNSRNFTPEQVIDIAQARAAQREKP